MLLAAVVGSGIMGDRLSGGNVAVALLANAIATGATLAALILTFGGISGAHLNPAVTIAAAIEANMKWVEVPGYILAQIAGALAGSQPHTLCLAMPSLLRRNTRVQVSSRCSVSSSQPSDWYL